MFGFCLHPGTGQRNMSRHLCHLQLGEKHSPALRRDSGCRTVPTIFRRTALACRFGHGSVPGILFSSQYTESRMPMFAFRPTGAVLLRTAQTSPRRTPRRGCPRGEWEHRRRRRQRYGVDRSEQSVGCQWWRQQLDNAARRSICAHL